MATISMPDENQVNTEVGEVLSDIRRTFGMTFVPKLFKALALIVANCKVFARRPTNAGIPRFFENSP
jgi:hypothetical protein